ncbi:MAG: hypothetical protein A2Y75_02580 [Candidatus Solincola sediminis]|uniref:Uncharacterized protein n=1 Tax=Candidatus Solincola sediminis TaxID=1797199 RepID=A0A1F2WJN8_9ACTN|nr:MAG: hypothetical protein A2Y75_02580 [Candidatus Solincola sediminis]
MEERCCPVCDGVLNTSEDAGDFLCSRCGARSRFDGESLIAINIRNYHLRLEELTRKERDLKALIEAEGGRGAGRNMQILRSLHEERQRILSEYSFLSCFQVFVDRW